MGEVTIPHLVGEVVATLVDIFRHQRQNEFVELLENAHSAFDLIDHDNWQGGIDIWALRLEIPVSIFAAIEPRLETIEKEIGKKLGYFDRRYAGNRFSEVTITPVSRDMTPNGQRMAPSETEVRRLWPDGTFRLFLSHVSAHRLAVSHLKTALGLRGISAFVAHVDIEPSLEWQHEIELALRSMHGLAALITPDFHQSLWTDQEVGWALGRNVAVVPVIFGKDDPYGLMGKLQGVRGALEEPDGLANSIARTLFTNTRSSGEMRRAVVHSLVNITSTEVAGILGHLLTRMVPEVSDEERSELWKACTENQYVAHAEGVAEAIYARFGSPREEVYEMPPDDDLPF